MTGLVSLGTNGFGRERQSGRCESSGTRTVGNGDSTGGGDGDSLVALNNVSGLGTVSHVLVDDGSGCDSVGNGDDGCIEIGSRGNTGKSDSRELHCLRGR